MSASMNIAALRDQAVAVVDSQSGATICTVKAGPKTGIVHIKVDIETDTGIPHREQCLMDRHPADGGIKYTEKQTLGGKLFVDAVNEDRAPFISFTRLTAEQADREEGVHAAIARLDHGIKLKDLEETWRSEASVVLYAVEHINPAELQHADISVKSDFATMLQALRMSTTCMYYVAENLWEDRQFVKSVVQIDGMILGGRMVPPKWREEIEIVMLACETNGMALKFASEELKNDRGVVLAAVWQRGTALMYASEELKSDYDVVLDAVRNNKMAIVHAKGGLRDDDEIRAAAGQGPSDKMMEKVERIKAKFHALDTNGDGYLSYDELKELLKKGNPDLDEAEIQLLYDEMDTHHDGKVDFHEFCDFVFRDMEEN